MHVEIEEFKNERMVYVQACRTAKLLLKNMSSKIRLIQPEGNKYFSERLMQ